MLFFVPLTTVHPETRELLPLPVTKAEDDEGRGNKPPNAKSIELRREGEEFSGFRIDTDQSETP